MKKANSKNGFTLLEVLIAMGIFAFFIAAFVTRQSYNLSASRWMRTDQQLVTIGTEVINEIIATQEKFEESMTLAPETKTLERDDNYSYTIEWSKIEIPESAFDFGEGNEQDNKYNEGQTGIQASLVRQIKKNIEENLWQLKVTVLDKSSNQSYSLSTWIQNPGKEVKFGAQ